MRDWAARRATARLLPPFVVVACVDRVVEREDLVEDEEDDESGERCC